MLFEGGLIRGIDASSASDFYLIEIDITVAGLHQAEAWPAPSTGERTTVTIENSQVALGNSNTQSTIVKEDE